MINTEKLMDAITDSGIKLGYIAEQMGLSRSGLYKKLNGKTEFKGSEISKLSEILGMTGERVNAIFFETKVD